MRGEHLVPVAICTFLVGIIPACAGSTTAFSSLGITISGSSPHARGAQASPSAACPAPQDHPRMRGEHWRGSDACQRHTGIIPACAGSTTLRQSRQSPWSGSSPHARGAPIDSDRIGRASRDHPRMRGEHALGGRDRPALQGIIPACAGSTPPDNVVAMYLSGSSPHARGALAAIVHHPRAAVDHPRMRGEHSLRVAPGDVCPVDHPRMRGEHCAR